MKDHIGFFPGIIKTGKASVHQDLHIDNIGLLGTTFLESVLKGEFDTITPLQWLQAGYVVDMPLSREGAFLRIAVPDPVKKVFVMDWLFIPFGSFVVRSNALFHSGHYGSPGNTRLHAMVFYKGSPTRATELGYLKKLTSMSNKSTIASGWGLAWKKGIEVKFQDAADVMNYTNLKDIPVKKSRASRYQKELAVRLPCDLLESYLYMLNPSPPARRVPPSKLGDIDILEPEPEPETEGSADEEGEGEAEQPDPPAPTQQASTKKRPNNGKQPGARGRTKNGNRSKNGNQRQTRATTHKRGRLA